MIPKIFRKGHCGIKYCEFLTITKGYCIYFFQIVNVLYRELFVLYKVNVLHSLQVRMVTQSSFSEAKFNILGTTKCICHGSVIFTSQDINGSKMQGSKLTLVPQPENSGFKLGLVQSARQLVLWTFCNKPCYFKIISVNFHKMKFSAKNENRLL